MTDPNVQWQQPNPHQPLPPQPPAPAKNAGSTVAICLSVLASGLIAGVLAWHPWSQGEAWEKPDYQGDVVRVDGADLEAGNYEIRCDANEVGLSCVQLVR